jgi:NAD-dependent SIR2 family protein deacetylase
VKLENQLIQENAKLFIRKEIGFMFQTESEFEKALEKAHAEFPLAENYPHTPDDGHIHAHDFVVYCHGGTDIVRCQKCGHEKQVPCTFDDDYS